MESVKPAAHIKADIEESQADVKGNGNLKRKHGVDGSSDDENDFLGFDLAEQNDSQHMIQNIKKICTDSSSDETTPRRNQQGIIYRATDILDPAFKLPFKYGWKRELVLRAEPTMSKEKGEIYYITPNGKKLRTRHEIMNHLHDDLTINNFTLVKEAIGADPNDEIIRPAKYYNYSRRSNVDPVIAEATPPLGKRVPKPKMPKGASPPPSSFPSTPTSTVSLPLFTPNHNRSLSTKENVQDSGKATSPTRKSAVKGKLKGDARCTIQCPQALGKIPQLQCKVCLCLYHHECAKKSNVDLVGTSFTCENCNFKFTKSSQNASNKKHHQPPQASGATHNFEKSPQTLVTLNGKKFIVFETDTSNGVAKKAPSRSTAQKPTESALKTNMSRAQPDTSATSISPFNFSTNFLQNVSTGFEVLLHTFQYLKVQELQRASRVCRVWNSVAQSGILWRTVRMKNSHVNDWEGFVRTLRRNGTNHLDLRKVLMGNQEEAWREFSDIIGTVDQLEGIDLCRCQSNIVEKLFVSNPNLKIINSMSLKDDKIDLEGLKNRQTSLEEFRMRTVHQDGLQLLNYDFAPLLNLRHLSLTTVENLHLLFNDNDQLRELTKLESLELGNCDKLNDAQFAENLGFLTELQRLRIEKGLETFNINKVLDVIATKLNNLVQLELINCDVKSNFVEAIKACQKVKRFLLIPTYVSQSAATNFMIIEGVMHLTNLDSIHWVVTNELLRVTELYQNDNRFDKGKTSPEKHGGSGSSSPVKAKDCIPVLKPVPGKEETEDDAGSANKQQQVEIVALKTVEEILQKKLTTTTVKMLKIPFQLTWRQVIESV